MKKIITLFAVLSFVTYVGCGGSTPSGASSPVTPAQIPTQVDYAAGDAIVVGSISGLNSSLNSLGKATDDTLVDAIYAVNPLGTMEEAGIKEDGKFYFTLPTGAAYLIVLVKGQEVVGTIKMSGCGLSSTPLNYTPGAKTTGTAEFEDGELTSGDVEVINLGEVTWDGASADASCEDLNLDAEQQAVISLLDKWLTVYSNLDVDHNGEFDFTEPAPGLTIDSDLEYGCDIELPSYLTDWLEAYNLSGYANRFCYKMYTLSLRTNITSAYNLNNLIGDEDDDYLDPDFSSNRFMIYFGAGTDQNYSSLDGSVGEKIYLYSSEPMEFGYSSYDEQNGLESPYTYEEFEAIEAYQYNEGSNYPFLDNRAGSLEEIFDANYYVSQDSDLNISPDTGEVSGEEYFFFSNVEAPNLEYSIAPQIKLITNDSDEVTSLAWRWMKNLDGEGWVEATEDDMKGTVINFLFLEDDANDDTFKEQCYVYSFTMSFRDEENNEYLNNGMAISNVIVPGVDEEGDYYICDAPDGSNAVVSAKISEGTVPLAPLETDSAVTPVNTKDVRIQVDDISGNRSLYEWGWHDINKWYTVTTDGGPCPMPTEALIGGNGEYYVDGGWQEDAVYRLEFNSDLYSNSNNPTISCETPVYGHEGAEETCDGGCEITINEDGTYALVFTDCQHDGHTCDMTFTYLGVNSD